MAVDQPKMGSEEQEFCLRWNNHQSTLISVLESLLQREMLVDVILAAEGKFLKVHRLVLCACSQYFEVSSFFHSFRCHSNFLLLETGSSQSAS